MVICLEQGANDLHMGPPDATAILSSRLIKIQNGFTFLVPADRGCAVKEAIKWVSVCLSVCLSAFLFITLCSL